MHKDYKNIIEDAPRKFSFTEKQKKLNLPGGSKERRITKIWLSVHRAGGRGGLCAQSEVAAFTSCRPGSSGQAAVGRTGAEMGDFSSERANISSSLPGCPAHRPAGREQGRPPDGAFWKYENSTLNVKNLYYLRNFSLFFCFLNDYLRIPGYVITFLCHVALKFLNWEGRQESGEWRHGGRRREGLAGAGRRAGPAKQNLSGTKIERTRTASTSAFEH